MPESDAAPVVHYRLSPAVDNGAMNALFEASWPAHAWMALGPPLSHSLLYVCAYEGAQLVGFVNVAWDGGEHAFLLDTTVHPAYRRRGIGRALVARAAEAAQVRGMTWLHVDYEPHLGSFYEGCGFRPTQAGLIALQERRADL